MQKRFMASALALAVLSLARPADVQAEELKGRVVSVSGGEARVALEGELLPSEGDPVAFSYMIPDTDMLARAGTGKVTGFEGATVIVRIDAGPSGPQEGFRVTINSAAPRRTRREAEREDVPPDPDSRSGDPLRDRIESFLGRTLLTDLVLAQEVWREVDTDRNGSNDYWVGPVAAFYFCKDSDGELLKSIRIDIARADRDGLSAYAEEEPTPSRGFWLGAIDRDEDGRDYVLHKDEKLLTNPARYGYCAWPAEYGRTGRLTFIVNQEGVVYSKDRGGNDCDRVGQWPGKDPEALGWRMEDRSAEADVKIEREGAGSDSPDSGEETETEGGGEEGEAAWLGVALGDDLVIDEVVEDSPADQAGLRVGDAIIEFDGDVVQDFVDLRDGVLKHPPGHAVEVRVRRGENVIAIIVKLGTRPR